MINIKDIWARQELKAGKDLIREKLTIPNHLSCYIGYIGFTESRIFELEVDSTVKIHRNYLRKFKGVEIQAIPAMEDTSQRYTIILNDKNLSDIFVLFIEDIIKEISKVTDPIDALMIINQRVSYWKKLFGKITGEVLSKEKQRGLYGELLILKLLLENLKNPDEILKSWVGPNSSNQDFTLHKNAIEVKTSKAGNPSVFISNEYQLDYLDWNNLFLVIVSVNESAGAKNSLSQLITEIRELLEFQNLVCEFEQKLELVGIDDSTIDFYEETGYHLRNCKFYRIDDGFPVILRCTLRHDAVFNVKYQIDITQCKSFETPEDQFLNSLL